MELDPALLDSLIEAANNKTNVSGYTHDFYNYPARFPPLFVREIINTFTKEGDLILDPFMGGGTTLIESKMLKRHSIGFDISTLAYFISKVKTRVLTTSQIIEINSWAHNVVPFLKCNMDYERPTEWIEAGYHRNLCDRPTWPIKILMEKYLSEVVKMRNARTRDFLRAALLKSGQWALDSKKIIPTAEEFRIRLVDNIFSMLQTIPSIRQTGKIRTICQNKPAHEVHLSKHFKSLGMPSLVLTSPPYPGVHVMYHRWQINGRRETPAPFWIANGQDGHGLSHYTMGDRKQIGLKNYFNNIQKSFNSIHKVCNSRTVVVQVIAFSEPSWQLPKYLETMELAGFTESKLFDKRLWRMVPNRKWYAQQKGNTNSSKELVLFHKIKSNIR